MSFQITFSTSSLFKAAFLKLCSYFVFIFQTLPTTTYELEIVAKDMAGSEVGLTGTATATITITDKNDHAPEFTHPLVRNIPFFSQLLLKRTFSFLSPCHLFVASSDTVWESCVCLPLEGGQRLGSVRYRCFAGLKTHQQGRYFPTACSNQGLLVKESY